MGEERRFDWLELGFFDGSLVPLPIPWGVHVVFLCLLFAIVCARVALLSMITATGIEQAALGRLSVCMCFDYVITTLVSRKWGVPRRLGC